MPALSSSLTDEDAYTLLKTASVQLWGEGRTQELDGALRTAGRHLSTLFSVQLAFCEFEPDYYDNAMDGNGQ